MLTRPPGRRRSCLACHGRGRPPSSSPRTCGASSCGAGWIATTASLAGLSLEGRTRKLAASDGGEGLCVCVRACVRGAVPRPPATKAGVSFVCAHSGEAAQVGMPVRGRTPSPPLTHTAHARAHMHAHSKGASHTPECAAAVSMRLGARSTGHLVVAVRALARACRRRERACRYWQRCRPWPRES
jgi:hypothetical protein